MRLAKCGEKSAELDKHSACQGKSCLMPCCEYDCRNLDGICGGNPWQFLEESIIFLKRNQIFRRIFSFIFFHLKYGRSQMNEMHKANDFFLNHIFALTDGMNNRMCLTQYSVDVVARGAIRP